MTLDKTVPKAAAYLLDFVSLPESRGNYECISSNKEAKLSKPITKMTLIELLKEMQTWRKTLGSLSSAAGRYQIIYKTLVDLIDEMKLDLNQKFTPDLQDRLGYHLLRKRGYDAFVFGRINAEEYGKRLAQEWASLPVLAGTKNYQNQNIKRGTSYYAGDGLNKHGVGADQFEAALKNALNLHADAPDAPQVKPQKTAIKVITGVVAGAGGVVAAGKEVVGSIHDTVQDNATVVTDAVTQGVQQVNDYAGYLDALKSITTYGPYVVGIVAVTTVVGIAGLIIYRKLQNDNG